MSSTVHYPEGLVKAFHGCYTGEGAKASNFFEEICYNSLFQGARRHYVGAKLTLIPRGSVLGALGKLVAQVVLLPLFAIALIARTISRAFHKHDLPSSSHTDTWMQKPVHMRPSGDITLRQRVTLHGSQPSIKFKNYKGGAFEAAQNYYKKGKTVGVAITTTLAGPGGRVGQMMEVGRSSDVGKYVHQTEEEKLYAVALRAEATEFDKLDVAERKAKVESLYEEALRFNQSYRNIWAEDFIVTPDSTPVLSDSAKGELIKLIFDARIGKRWGIEYGTKPFQKYSEGKREINFSGVKESRKKEFSGGVCAFKAELPVIRTSMWRGVREDTYIQHANDPNSRKIPVVFVSGHLPNVSSKKGAVNQNAKSYKVFKKFIVQAMIGRMKTAAEAGVDVYVENFIGKNAGKWQKRIKKDYKSLVQEAMDTEITVSGGRGLAKPSTWGSYVTPSWWPFREGAAITLGHCFERVVVAERK